MEKYKILVIEDNPTTRKFLRVTLEAEQYEVLEAADGKTALEQAKKKPDLILQDLILPDIDGVTLNSKLRQMPEVVDIPILALSGFLSKVEETHASESGFTAFLVKPIEIPHLLEVLHAYLPTATSLATEEQIGEGRLILLVDDNIAQLKFIRLQLAHIGYKIATATSGAEALEKINKHLPDAVVSDVLMPHMDGFELCLSIRRDPRTTNLPVILLTANYLEEADKALARKVSANAFITRTSNIKELVNALEMAFKNPTPLSFPEPMDFFKEEHTHRLIRQLERQITNNTGLAQQCALQAAQLSLLGGVADALTSSTSLEHTLRDVLTTCLDVAGISKGALYLFDKNNQFQLCQMIGYRVEEKSAVEHFFNLPNAFEELSEQKTIIQVPSDDIEEKTSQEFLELAGVTSALLIPLISEAKCLGGLFLGSKITNITESGAISFAHTLGMQLGQALALATAFENIYESEQRYRSLMNHASCGIVITNHSGEIVEINKRGKILLNAKEQSIIGKQLMDFVVPGDRLFAMNQLKEILIEPSTKTTEVRIQPLNSEQRSIEFSGIEVDITKEKLLLLIINDVTERNHLRTQALLNDKLTTVGTLTTGIAHEINNPLASILANLSFLNVQVDALKEFMSDLKHLNQEKNTNIKSERLNLLLQKQESKNFLNELNDVVSDIRQATDHMHDVVQGLKNFARIDDDKPVPVDINDVINTAIKMAMPIIKLRAEVEKDLSNDLPQLVLNSGKLHQVFLNLIVNAAQAISPGNVNKNKIRISTKKSKQYISIEVSDTGCGIAPELLSKIFDPFFTTKAAGSGTGLGLTICEEIVKGFRGYIEVDSALGQGTTFTVYIPCQS